MEERVFIRQLRKPQRAANRRLAAIDQHRDDPEREQPLTASKSESATSAIVKDEPEQRRTANPVMNTAQCPSGRVQPSTTGWPARAHVKLPIQSASASTTATS